MTEKKRTVGKPADDFIRIQDLWGMFIPKWYWFLLSLLVALTVAALYLLSTPPVYTRSAAILVKDDSKSGAATGSMGDFADLGLFKSNTNINNELLTLASPTLMTEVVGCLDLNETFTVRRGLKRIELYKSAPVAVVFGGKADLPVDFTRPVGLGHIHPFRFRSVRRKDGRGLFRQDGRLHTHFGGKPGAYCHSLADRRIHRHARPFQQGRRAGGYRLLYKQTACRTGRRESHHHQSQHRRPFRAESGRHPEHVDWGL